MDDGYHFSGVLLPKKQLRFGHGDERWQQAS